MIKFDIAFFAISNLNQREMIKIKEEIYVWLSLIDELNYLVYLKLIKIFHSTINLYEISKNKFKFENYLNSNNFNLDEKMKKQILDKNLKIKSNKIYNCLKSKNVKIIPINSKYYPRNLKNIFSPPLCIYIGGNIKLLERKKIYVYENNNITKYAKKIIEFLYKYILNKSNYLILNKNLYIEEIDLENNNYFNFEDKNNLYVYYISKDKESGIKTLDIKAGILDLIIIPEADYNKEISIIVDCFLELGKEILVFPNEIFNKNAYFSNYLIKNGANILTNLHQIQEILNNL